MEKYSLQYLTNLVFPIITIFVTLFGRQVYRERIVGMEVVKMNKKELVAAIAENTEVSKKDVEKVLDGFINVVVDEVKNGGKVQLVGFGTFESAERGERAGRNPKTGEAVTIPASKAFKFKPGKAVKDALNPAE